MTFRDEPERTADYYAQEDAPVRDRDGVFRSRTDPRTSVRARRPHPTLPDPGGWVGECAEEP